MCHKDFRVWVSWKRLNMYIRDRYKKKGGDLNVIKEVSILWFCFVTKSPLKLVVIVSFTIHNQPSVASDKPNLCLSVIYNVTVPLLCIVNKNHGSFE